jgi:hypothetical protein
MVKVLAKEQPPDILANLVEHFILQEGMALIFIIHQINQGMPEQEIVIQEMVVVE